MRQDFINAIENGDVKRARMMLSNELLLDPRGKTFSEMLQYAKDNLPGLFEENKPTDFTIPEDRILWDEALMFKLKKDLDNNFSVEKLGLFETVVLEVGKKKAQELEQEEADNNSHSEQQNPETEGKEGETQSHRRKFIDKKTSGIVTASGAVLAVIGIGLGKTVLTVVGGVLVVGGIVLFTVTDKKK